ELQDEVVLARPERVDRLGLGRIGGRAHRQLDAARLQERPHAVEARLAVDVLVVVGRPVELVERLAVPLRPLAQEVVEHLLPRPRVDLRRLREHAVEIEETSTDAIGQIEHDSGLPRWSRFRRDAVRSLLRAGAAGSLVLSWRGHRRTGIRAGTTSEPTCGRSRTWAPDRGQAATATARPSCRPAAAR